MLHFQLCRESVTGMPRIELEFEFDMVLCFGIRLAPYAVFSNFIWSLHGMPGMKICSNVSGHMTMPIHMVKNFKNLLRNQEANDLETWYTASGTRVLPLFLYDDPGLTLTIFMTGSDLFPNASALWCT